MVDLLNGHIVVDGQFVSSKIEQLVQSIKDYDPDLDVQWIPTDTRKPGDPAFCIRYSPVGQKPFILFFVKTEEEFDERVLMRIIANDQRHGKTTLSEFEAWELSHKLVQDRKFKDSMEEAEEIARSVFKSHLNTYRVSKDLVIKDYGNRR